MTVPFLDVGASYNDLKPELDAAYERVMSSGRYVLGAEVEAFEREFAAAVGADEAVGVGTGLDALAITLRAHGVGPGDEVIVPVHTFIATWLAVARCGAEIVPVEVADGTLLIDPDAARAAITPRTAAIVAVHIYGHPAPMAALGRIADAHGLLLLEDAAQAHGASVGGRRAGALAAGAAFSFYPAKNLGAYGDGGAMTTDDPGVADRARRLRSYGSGEPGVHGELSGSSRLDGLQAAFLRVKLRALDRWNARRAEIATAYLAALGDVEGVHTPQAPSGTTVSSWHLFCVRHRERDALRSHLDAAGVQTLVHYPTPPHLADAFSILGLGPGSFPVAERAAREVVSLPIGPHLDDEDVSAVIAAVRAFRA